MRILNALLIFIVALAPVQQAGAQLTCEGLFTETPDVREVAREIGIQESADLMSRYPFVRFERKWSPNKLYTPLSFERRVEESYELLNSLRSDDKRTKDFSQKPEEITRWAETALLRDSLRSYLIKGPVSPSSLQTATIKIRRLTENPLVRGTWTLLTHSLLKRSDTEVPPDLLAKIAVDGLDTHLDELKSAYKLQGQNKVERYRRLTKAFRYFVLTLNLFIMANQMQASDERHRATELRQLIESQKQYQDMNKSLDALDKAIDAI